jgi:hypothetical protein
MGYPIGSSSSSQCLPFTACWAAVDATTDHLFPAERLLDWASKDRGPGASIDESGFPVQFAAIRVAYTILE